jgi:hypothetical protein
MPLPVESPTLLLVRYTVVRMRDNIDTLERALVVTSCIVCVLSLVVMYLLCVRLTKLRGRARSPTPVHEAVVGVSFDSSRAMRSTVQEVVVSV